MNKKYVSKSIRFIVTDYNCENEHEYEVSVQSDGNPETEKEVTISVDQATVEMPRDDVPLLVQALQEMCR
jgi:hypothetical protein